MHFIHIYQYEVKTKLIPSLAQKKKRKSQTINHDELFIIL